MKTSLFFTVFCACVMYNPVNAQSVVKDAITLNGLIVGNSYTEQQLVEVLGQPTKVIPPQETDASENTFLYYYGTTRLEFIAGEFYGFSLQSSEYKVNNLITVGDHTSKIDMLGGIKRVENSSDIQIIDWRPSREGVYSCASIRFYYDGNNVITMITAFINDL